MAEEADAAREAIFRRNLSLVNIIELITGLLGIIGQISCGRSHAFQIT